MKYSTNTIFIVGNSKTQQNNPITQVYGMFYLGFVVEKKTGSIVDVGASATLPITTEFIKSIFVGRNIESDADEIIRDIENRYFGSSQKAMIVAFKDALKKYLLIKSGKKIMSD
ncbi:MAG: hypothetical protein PWP45_1631 [Tepidanaerobacteraceae bacterium]|nr:hypothetical protein [Tepidanaerobacteraceae bacterium]